MRWPPWSQPDRDDEALDAALVAGDAELLNYVRTYADPAHALAALLAECPPDNQPDTMATIDPALAGPAQQIQIRVLVLALTHAVTPAHDLADDLARDLAHARDLARSHNLARTLAHDLDFLLGLGGTLDRTLARTLVRALVRARDLDHALARVLAHNRDFDRGLSLARDHSRDLALNLALDLAHDLDLVRDLVRDLEDSLASVEIDASGADLAELELAESSLTEVLAGVVWDEDTRWPPDLRESIAARSEEIRPGVYRVRGGTERDPHETAGV
ncbi:hypothetical protein [Actinomadura soli]|uniref:hypothetical protein n=1 Tax=Actinomadura soli TaxID=2508997 RepID=UPI001486456C|nr:hypothetical protein [Actinomadura soli]